MIKEVSMFQCSLCTHNHSTMEYAEKCHKDCKKKAARKKREAKRIKDLDYNAKIVCREAESIEEVAQLYVKHAKQLGVILQFARFSFRFNNLISNTHSCPYDGVQNWERVDHKPQGYPGYNLTIHGNIEPVIGKKRLSFSDFVDKDRWGSNKNYLAGIHTGSGSGGASFQYDGRLFIDDFPKIKKKYDEYLLLAGDKKKYDDLSYTLNDKYCKAKQKNTNEDPELIKIIAEEEDLVDRLSKMSKKRIARKYSLDTSFEKRSHSGMVEVVLSAFDFDNEEYVQLGKNFR